MHLSSPAPFLSGDAASRVYPSTCAQRTAWKLGKCWDQSQHLGDKAGGNRNDMCEIAWAKIMCDHRRFSGIQLLKAHSLLLMWPAAARNDIQLVGMRNGAYVVQHKFMKHVRASSK
jgi:hypothetical protein